MAAFEDLPPGSNHRILPLAVLQPRAFFDPVERHLAAAAIGGKHRGVFEKVDGVITPFPGNDHSAINIQNSIELAPFETRTRPAPSDEFFCPTLWITPCLVAGRGTGENYGFVAHQG